ncbi:hypothetical protein ACMYR3_05295 [Ampullimonas aquatilis]|uniref:hypothetical protein n=1 Tax=Ampullimonas aquatilis TaxID=1341549 RepID=UPI003C790983
MQKIDAFSLEQHHGPYQAWPLKTRLYFRGQDTGSAINGYEIEAQYQCRQGYLLITAYDCPFEESNEFILLDKAFKVIAQKSLMALYDSYLLHAHWPVSNNALRLHYQTKLCYTLSIENGFGLFGKKLRLSLQHFKDIDHDPQVVASISALQASLKAIGAELDKMDKSSSFA